jgi:hypothetical protein
LGVFTILGHSNIKMTERYAKPARHHIAHKTTAREMWTLLRAADAETRTKTASTAELSRSVVRNYPRPVHRGVSLLETLTN